jgi:acyl-CoA synthetase (AMP-forming)/AMP-acid ligase II
MHRAAGADTVHGLIENAAARMPHAVYALACDSGEQQQIDFASLASGCRRVARLLHRAGARPGDTVSVVMPNGLQTLRLLLGAMHAGCVVNPVNLLSQPDQMRYVLAHSDCRVVCVAPEWEERVRAMLLDAGRPVDLIVAAPDAAMLPGEDAHDDKADRQDSTAFAPPSPDAVALLMYTSGTTGLPKGVMLTQHNLAANAHAIGAEHALGAADRVLAVLPLYHINAFCVTMLAPLAFGGSLAMPPKFSAGRFWQQAGDTRCTWINVVPTMISYLLEGEPPPRTQTASLRFCRSASAALPPEHHRAFEQKFGIGIVETMGLTETAAPSFSNPMEPALRKLGSVGRASGCEACVIDAALAEVPDGATGELAIRGPNVMRGYYKNDDATRASFTPDGWLRTGDLGHRDADGFFFVTGRIKELIIKGGENIAPREIDEALLQHPAVLEAAAVGVPDRHYGQEIGVCIVLREGCACTEDELRAFSATALGRYKAPGHYRFVTDLPRGPSGKVQRLKLLPLFTA